MRGGCGGAGGRGGVSGCSCGSTATAVSWGDTLAGSLAVILLGPVRAMCGVGEGGGGGGGGGGGWV